MNAAERARLQEILVKALEENLVNGELLINILEAIEDVENYIGDQLSDEEREAIGI